jgi:hypothetical protein
MHPKPPAALYISGQKAIKHGLQEEKSCPCRKLLLLLLQLCIVSRIYNDDDDDDKNCRTFSTTQNVREYRNVDI